MIADGKMPKKCCSIVHMKPSTSLSGCQLEPCNLECEHKFILVVTKALGVSVEKEGDSRSLLCQWVYTQLETDLYC